MEKALPKFKFDIEEWQLVPSDGGRFEVLVDGELIYSKLETGRFPDHDDILKQIRKRQESAARGGGA
jgi:selenoprotein W-related protein